jgi:hypothetical protein
VSSASSSSSLSSSSSEYQQQYQAHQAVNVDQLKAWNANLLQRMMSDQRHRRNSMTNPNTMHANANASLAHNGVRRNMSNRNISSDINNSSNIINNNSASATSVSNSPNNRRVHASSNMSLHSLLVAPRTEILAKAKRAADFHTTNSLPPTGAIDGASSMDGNDGSSSSNSMLSNTNNMPYHAFLRRDSLCGFKQI